MQSSLPTFFVTMPGFVKNIIYYPLLNYIYTQSFICLFQIGDIIST